MPSRLRVISNFVLFQLGWFAAVLGGAHDRVLSGSAIAFAVVAIHVLVSHRPATELKLIALVSSIGLLWDSALTQYQVIVYPYGTLVAGMAPLWIVAVWSLFATTFNVSLRWMQQRYVIAAVFGAVGAPLSFLAGERMGALIFPDRVMALLLLAAGWGVMMPALMWLAQCLDGVSTQSPVDKPRDGVLMNEGQ